MLKSLIIALSMYSKIPVPQIKWDTKSMKYALCFFPVVGILIGAAVCAAGFAMFRINMPELFRAAILTAVPVIVTGGIHLDGFLDTADALGSWQDKDRRLEILKDSHSGAFAIIAGCTYFALSLGAWSAVGADKLACVGVSYVLSRALSGLAVVTFPLAKNTGLAASFANAAHKKIVGITMILWIAASIAAMLILDLKTGLIITAAAVIAMLLHYRVCVKYFGGITGDLAGFFLQVFELFALAAAAGCSI